MLTVTFSDETLAELEAPLLQVAQAVDDAIERGVASWRHLFPDPDLRKHLERIRDAVSELLRLVETGLLDPEHRRRVLLLLGVAHARLERITTESAWSLLHDFELLLIDAGDASTVCGRVAGELQWRKTQTSWLTWDKLFKADDAKCKALDLYVEGKAIPAEELDSARRKLLALSRARRDDEEAHRSRATLRGQNLLVLTGLLALLLPVFLVAYWYASSPHPKVWVMVMLPLAGALGAGLSGTLKARDRLTREADIRRFRFGLPAQLLVGGVAAVIVVTLLQADVVTIGNIAVGPRHAIAQAAFGLLAGFSEPFVLDTIGRAAKLGSSQDDAKAAKPASA